MSGSCGAAVSSGRSGGESSGAVSGSVALFWLSTACRRRRRTRRVEVDEEEQEAEAASPLVSRLKLFLGVIPELGGFEFSFSQI